MRLFQKRDSTYFPQGAEFEERARIYLKNRDTPALFVRLSETLRVLYTIFRFIHCTLSGLHQRENIELVEKLET